MEGKASPCSLSQVPGAQLTAHAQRCSPRGAHDEEGMPCQRAGTSLQAHLLAGTVNGQGKPWCLGQRAGRVWKGAGALCNRPAVAGTLLAAPPGAHSNGHG